MNFETLCSVLMQIALFFGREAKAVNKSVGYWEIGGGLTLGVGPKGTPFVSSREVDPSTFMRINLTGVEPIAAYLVKNEIVPDLTAPLTRIQQVAKTVSDISPEPVAPKVSAKKLKSMIAANTKNSNRLT